MIPFSHPDIVGKEPKKKANSIGICKHGNNISACYQCDFGSLFPSKKKPKKKKPTGILKDLSKLKRYRASDSMFEQLITQTKDGAYVEWSDVEAIINKYTL